MEFTAEMIAGLLGGTIVGDKSTAVHTVSSIDGGKKGALAYLTNPKYEQFVYTTEASIVLVDNSFEPKEEVKATLIKLPNVGAAVLQLLEMYNAMKPQKKGISKMASISEKATIGEDCYIGDFAVVEAGAVIGDGAKIYPQCYVGDGVKIVSGLFEGYNGTVQAISEDNSMVTVLVKRGRRDMPVELEASCLMPENA